MTIPISDDPVSKTVAQTERDEDFEDFSHSARSLDVIRTSTDDSSHNHEKNEKTLLSTHDDDVTAENNTNDSSNNIEAQESPNNNNDNNNNKNDPAATEEATEDLTNHKYVTPKDFELLKVIGMGAFGKVLQVRSKSTSKIAAMKVISKRLLRRKISYVANIHAERNILSKINQHPFIVTMHCSFQTREKLFIVMDFLAGGELFLRLGREGVFLERTAAFYVAEITLALEHLHGLGILHRDLKPENILLGSDGHLCITDFGLAKDFNANDSAWGGAKKEGGEGNDEDDRANTICGTQEYMAPEMVARKGYGKAADFWSLGCIAYEMLAGNPPFESRKGSKDLFRKIMNERVRMPDGSSAAACQLLKGLLNRDAQARLGAAKSTMFKVGGIAGLKQCQFFDGLDWGKLERKEIDPPVDVTVEGENDLRHFHDEFVQMSLPRSVMEMSQDHFQPRRCDSENFRGFSFIQEGFVLPERKHSETEKYWNNADADGESLSECASSVFDDDYGTNANTATDVNKNNLETVDESAAAAQPAKKKRPPRKKKKKKQQEEEQKIQQDVTAAPAPAPPTLVETPLAETKVENKNEEKTLQKKLNTLAVSSENKQSAPAAVAEPKVTVQQQQKQLPQSAPPMKKPTPPPPPPPQWESVGGRSKKANAPTTTKPAVVSLSSGTSAGGAAFPRRSQQQQPPPPPPQQHQTNTYKPAPGSWAGRATATATLTATTTPSARNYAKQHHQQQPPPPIQSDWTKHSPSWSQRGMVRKPLQQQQYQQQPRRPMTAAAPPLPAAPAPSQPQLWPALGNDDFPPPPGGGGGGAAKTANANKPWGSKSTTTSAAKTAWSNGGASKNKTANAWR